MRPYQLTSYYLNEDGGGGGSSAAVSATDSFHGGLGPQVEVVGNTTGLTVESATIYVNLIKTTINGLDKYDLFCNYNMTLGPGETTGDVTIRTILNAGTPTSLPNIPDLVIVMFGTSQLETSGTSKPTVFSFQDGVVSVAFFDVGTALNWRGNYARSFLVTP